MKFHVRVEFRVRDLSGRNIDRFFPRPWPRRKSRRGTPLDRSVLEKLLVQGPGQFWSKLGERHLLALELAWRNRDWNELWTQGAA